MCVYICCTGQDFVECFVFSLSLNQSLTVKEVNGIKIYGRVLLLNTELLRLTHVHVITKVVTHPMVIVINIRRKKILPDK